MPTTTQCTKPPASGSCCTSANSNVPSGAPLQATGSWSSAPSHVNCDGMGCPSVNADEVSTNGSADAPGAGSDVGADVGSAAGVGVATGVVGAWLDEPALGTAVVGVSGGVTFGTSVSVGTAVPVEQAVNRTTAKANAVREITSLWSGWRRRTRKRRWQMEFQRFEGGRYELRLERGDELVDCLTRYAA